MTQIVKEWHLLFRRGGLKLANEHGLISVLVESKRGDPMSEVSSARWCLLSRDRAPLANDSVIPPALWKDSDDPETRSFLEQALREPESIAEEDQILFTVLMSEYFFAFENLFRLYEQGLIDRESWTNSLTNSRVMFNQPGARQFASQRTGALAQRFWAAVTSELDNSCIVD